MTCSLTMTCIPHRHVFIIKLKLQLVLHPHLFNLCSILIYSTCAPSSHGTCCSYCFDMLYLVLWHALVVCASECLRPTRPLMRSYSSAHEFKPCSILHHGCIFETKTLTLADTLMQPHSHTLMHTCACLLMRRHTNAHIHRQRQRRIQTQRQAERERPAEYSRQRPTQTERETATVF